MSKEQAPKEQKPTWTVEEFYFGNANTPSWAIYRNSGERLQRQIEMPLPLALVKPDGGQYEADLDVKTPWTTMSTVDFLGRYQDCKILIQDSYPLGNGDRRQPPSLWLIGWEEVTTPEGRLEYEADKKDGTWKKKTTSESSALEKDLRR